MHFEEYDTEYVDALETENDRLKAALESLIGPADHFLGGETNTEAGDDKPISIATTFGRLRAARQVLKDIL